MGLFSTKKTIKVSSVVYNMAGPESGRKDYLKSTVSGAIVANNGKSIGQTITDSYLGGPGMKLRSYGRWARTQGYNNALGMFPGNINLRGAIPDAELAPHLPVTPGDTVMIQKAVIGSPDYSYWVDRYILTNQISALDTGYVADFDQATKTVSITFANGTVQSFVASDYDPYGTYMYVAFNPIRGMIAATPTRAARPNYLPLVMLIYKYGSGNTALDALFSDPNEVGTFFPPIPIRIDNGFINPSWFGELVPFANKALKRSANTDLQEIIQKIAANPSVNDIDYAFVTFGVSLNVKENACKRYIYEFFQESMLGQQLGDAEYITWKQALEESKQLNATWREWLASQNIANNDLYGTPEPERPSLPPAPSFSVRVISVRPEVHYDITVGWNAVEETVGSGLAKADAKDGDLWFEYLGPETYNEGVFVSTETEYYTTGEVTLDRIRLTWQQAGSWRALTIYGLYHENRVYGGKTVVITAKEALGDDKESGFIIPLHEDIYKRMPLKEATQMANACIFMVFNCYEIVKQQWYQQGWFQVVLIVAIIVITVYTGGAGASAVGLLGTNAAVGAAIGFTGMAAVIAGAVANAVAAMILTQIITRVSSAIFGDKIGLIIGVIASIAAINVGSSLSSGQGWASNFSSLMRAENLMKLTSSIGDGYAKAMQGDTQAMIAKAQTAGEEFARQSEDMEKKLGELMGSGPIFDPTLLTNIASFNPVIEQPRDFLSRTLMTGSDIAEMSMDLVSNFTTITTSTELPV